MLLLKAVSLFDNRPAWKYITEVRRLLDANTVAQQPQTTATNFRSFP